MSFAVPRKGLHISAQNGKFSYFGKVIITPRTYSNLKVSQGDEPRRAR